MYTVEGPGFFSLYTNEWDKFITHEKKIQAFYVVLVFLCVLEDDKISPQRLLWVYCDAEFVVYSDF